MANTPACVLSIPNDVNPVRADWIHRPGLAVCYSILYYLYATSLLYSLLPIRSFNTLLSTIYILFYYSTSYYIYPTFYLIFYYLYTILLLYTLFYYSTFYYLYAIL